MTKAEFENLSLMKNWICFLDLIQLTLFITTTLPFTLYSMPNGLFCECYWHDIEEMPIKSNNM